MHCRIILFLLVGMLFSCLCSAQEIDSLLQLIPYKKNDSIKADLYRQAIYALINNDNARLLEVYQKGKQTLEKHPTIHANALHGVAWGLVRTGQFTKADSYYDQAQDILKDSVRIFALRSDIALSYYCRLNFVKAEALLLRNISDLERQHPLPLKPICRSYNILGLIYFEQGATKKAEKIFKLVIQHAQKAGLTVDESISYINLALIMLKRGLYTKALNYGKNSIGMIENPNANNVTNADYFLAFTQIYYKLQLYEKGDNLILKTKGLIAQTKDTYLPIATKLIQLEKFLLAKKLNKSEFLIKEIDEDLKSTNHLLLFPYFLEQQIIFFLLKKDTATALTGINSLLQLSLEEEIIHFEAKSYLFLSDIHATTNPNQAIEYSKKGLKIAQILPNEILLEESYQQLARLFERKQQFKEATFYQKSLLDLQDTVQLSNSGIQIIATLLGQLEKSLEGNFQPKEPASKTHFFNNIFENLKFIILLVFMIFILLKIGPYYRKVFIANKKQISTNTNDILIKKEASLQKQQTANFQYLIEQFKSEKIDWPQFIIEYERLFPKFMSNFRQLPISHTSNTLRHCICLRMNLTLKETANLLHVSISAVKSARNRLKKQMNLTSKESIQEFINGLG